MKLVAIDMPGVDKEAYTAGDKTFEDTYRLDSTNRVPFDVTYLVSKGYFDSQIIININKYNPVTGQEEEYRPGAFYGASVQKVREMRLQSMQILICLESTQMPFTSQTPCT